MADSGETATPDNEMEVVESCSAEQLETVFGGKDRSDQGGVSDVCPGSEHPPRTCGHGVFSYIFVWF